MANDDTMHHEVHGDEHVGHIVPVRVLAGVAALLLLMTAITVIQAKFPAFDFGSANIYIALLIAGFKASIVCLYFMHLRWDSPFNAIVLLSSVVFVVLMIGLTITDTDAYLPEIKQFETSPIAGQ